MGLSPMFFAAALPGRTRKTRCRNHQYEGCY